MRLGFFTPTEEFKNKSKKTAVHLSLTEPNCATCGLYTKCINSKMDYTGQGRMEVFNLAEAPGEEEDTNTSRLQLIGEAGKLYRDKLSSHGIDLDRDFWKINCVNCRPTTTTLKNGKVYVSNREPTDLEVQCCWPMVRKAIEKTNPKFIWLLGATATEAYFAGRVKTDRLKITYLRRHCIPDYNNNAWVIPMFHPSSILQKKNDKNLDAIFNMDLKWAVSCINRPFPKRPPFESGIKLLLNFDELVIKLKWLKAIGKTLPFIVIDYETSGLKPYREGHKIYVIGFSINPLEVYSFPYKYPFWSTEQIKIIRQLWIDILSDPDIKKVAQGLKFEHKWGRFEFKTETENWYWDSMVAQHLIDTRKYQTALDFQAFVRWGVDYWGHKIDKFKKDSDKLGFNSLYKVDLKELLIYNGMDLGTTHKLAEEQIPEFKRNKELKNQYDMFQEGMMSFADMEDEGIPVKEEYYKEEEDKWTGIIATNERKLYASSENKLFFQKFNRNIDLGSTKDLSTLFFKLLEISPTKYTDKGNSSVNEEALSKMNLPFTKDLVLYRKGLKVRDTYLAQFKREIIYGKLHPFFDLDTETGRGNSSKPNFQNIPIREEEAKKSIRRGISARLGEELIEADYNGIEVRIMCCYTHDPNLIRYIKDPTTDMHRDEAMDILMLPKEMITKPLRHMGKNGFVFPQFYGDWWKACAQYCWDMIQNETLPTGQPVLEHLYDKGILSYAHFEQHMRGVENRFWTHLQVTKEWRDDIIDFYHRKGYVPSFFGFRRTGYLSNNQIVNSPVQGTAFHCLLWACNRINRIRKEEKWVTALLAQIHDSLLSSVVPDEREHVLRTYLRVMVNELMAEHPWIIVPIEVEFESSGINGSWADKKSIQVPLIGEKDTYCGRTRKVISN